MQKILLNESENIPSKTLFVGIDISKNKHCARAVNNNNRKESQVLFFDNRIEGFNKLLEQVKIWANEYECNNIIFGMEPTACYWMPIYHYLERNNYKTNLVSTLKVKRSKDLIDNSPNKSDPKDAALIARLMRDGNILDYRKYNKHNEEIKGIMNEIEGLNKTIGVYTNRIETWLAKYFPELRDYLQGANSITLLWILRECPFPADIAKMNLYDFQKALFKVSKGCIDSDKSENIYKTACKSIGIAETTENNRKSVLFVVETIEHCKNRIKELKESLLKIKSEVPDFEILTSIPGVGLLCASSILAFLGDLRQYRNAKQVIKKAGLNLCSYSSGKHNGKPFISRRGNFLLRKNMYMTSLHQTRNEKGLYKIYKDMTDRGVAKKKALIGVMRKILRLAYALVRDGRLYEEKYNQNIGVMEDLCVIWRAKVA